MIPVLILILLSVTIVSLISVVALIPLLMKKDINEHFLLILVSISAGTLFGAALFHLLPEGIEVGGLTLGTMLYVMLGILAFFIFEKFIHWHHHHNLEHPTSTHKHTHRHGYQLAAINLVGDALHNFVDGIVIASSYLVNVPLGIAATISIVLHEIPQEIADFGVLLYSGFSKKKAVVFNFLSAIISIFGALVGFLLSTKLSWFNAFILPFAAGNFLYIAGSSLVPELHKHCKLRESIFHLIAIIFGVSVMIALLFIGGGHTHG